MRHPIDIQILAYINANKISEIRRESYYLACILNSIINYNIEPLYRSVVMETRFFQAALSHSIWRDPLEVEVSLLERTSQKCLEDIYMFPYEIRIHLIIRMLHTN